MGSVWHPFVILDKVRARFEGRAVLQDNIPTVLIFATGMEISEGGLPSMNDNIVELANDGHSEHRA